MNNCIQYLEGYMRQVRHESKLSLLKTEVVTKDLQNYVEIVSKEYNSEFLLK